MARDRVMILSLVASAALHLTMVTLFSIELRYERRPLQYFAFDIVNVSELEQAPPYPRASLNLPSSPEPDFSPSRPAEYLASLPEISLPTLKFNDIAAIAPLESVPQIRSAYPPLFREEPRDAWARFGEEIQDLRDALRRLPLLERWDDGTDESKALDDLGLLLHPTPGVKAEVSWIIEPRDRRLLYSPRLDAEWRARTDAPSSPVTIVFRVNREGRVTEVLTPLEETSDLIAVIAESLGRYRFEPRPNAPEGGQPATLTLSADEAAP